MFGLKSWFKKPSIQEPSPENFFESGLRKGLSDKDYLGAIKYLTVAIKENSSKGEAYFHLGLFKKNLSNYEGAVADLSNAIDLLPDPEQAYFNRALARFHVKGYAGVIED